MCTRYSFTSPAESVRDLFDGLDSLNSNFEPQPDIRPTNPAPIVRLNPSGRPNGHMEMVTIRWWLVPRWAKEISSKYTMVNAAAETLSERPAYREPYKTQRCLVPADAFFEWPVIDGKKTRYTLRLKGGALFAMAGLWERAEQLPDGPVESFTIVTTAANDLVARYHVKARMPVILLPDQFRAWLDPTTPMDEVAALLGPIPDAMMEAFPTEPTPPEPQVPERQGSLF